MTSLWLLSRIRFGVVEMGFEPKNVTKITSYHITSTYIVCNVTIVYRRVVESLSDVFRLLCYVKKELMILWFILPALPLLLYIGTYLSSMYMNTSVEPVVIYVFGEELVIIT